MSDIRLGASDSDHPIRTATTRTVNCSGGRVEIYAIAKECRHSSQVNSRHEDRTECICIRISNRVAVFVSFTLTHSLTAAGDRLHRSRMSCQLETLH